MSRSVKIALVICLLAGCAVIKTADVTDASFKRHQSVSVFGWPVYTRVTDREPGTSSNLATKRGPRDRPEFPTERSEFSSDFRPEFPTQIQPEVQPAEMLQPIEPGFSPESRGVRSGPEGM